MSIKGNLAERKENAEKSFKDYIDEIASLPVYLVNLWKKKKTRFALLTGGMYLGSIEVVSYFWQVVSREELMDPISSVIYLGQEHPEGFVFAGVIAVFVGYTIMKYKRMYQKDYTIDPYTKTKIAKDNGTYGTAHYMTAEEKQSFLIEKDNPVDLMAPVIGIDQETKLYVARNAKRRFTNSNSGVFGPPGVGKSICMINNDVLQAISSGESIIVVDTKGAVYKDTAYVAEKAGVTTKIFNVKPDEIMYSDGCDLLGLIPNGDDVISRTRAKSSTKTVVKGIMENLYSVKDETSVWYKCVFNLFMSAILIVKYDKTLKTHTLADVYEMLIDCMNYQGYEDRWDDTVLPDKFHPAYNSYKTFKGTVPAVKDSGYGNILTDLNFLDNEYVRRVVSTPDIDLVLPGTKQCVYYIVVSDKDTTNNLLVALFIDQMFEYLVNYADSQKKGGELRLPVPVNFEIDEFKNIGRIPMFTNKLSTVRSRGINIKWVLQDITQLQEMYPDAWEEVITDCTTLLLLGVGHGPTMGKFVEEWCSTYTAYSENTRKERDVSDLVKTTTQYGETSGTGKRSLITAAEARGEGETGLQDTEVLVMIAKAPPLRLNKFMWWNHPIYKALNLDNEKTKRYTTEHIPAWRAEFDEEYQKALENENSKNGNNSNGNSNSNGNAGNSYAAKRGLGSGMRKVTLN